MKSTQKLWSKRIFSLLLVIAMLLPTFLVPAQAASSPAEEIGAKPDTVVSPVAPPADKNKIVRISSVEDMRNIDPSDPEAYYVLDADINLDLKYPSTKSFCGTFDGRGHTVTFKTRKCAYFLFLSVEPGAVIQNVRFRGAMGNTYPGKGEHGPCGQFLRGSVINCVSEVSADNGSGFTRVLDGGVISNCLSVGNEDGQLKTAIASQYNDGKVLNTYWKDTLKDSDNIPAEAMTNCGKKTADDLKSEALLKELNANRGEYGSEWIMGQEGHPVLKPNTPEENTKPQGPYVYFQYDNGEVQEMDSNDTFTLNALSQGKFVLAGTDKEATWDCVTTIEYINKHYWISPDGRYSPRHVEKVKATVKDKNNPSDVLKTFYIDNVSSNIEQLKVFVGEQEVSLDKPYEANGAEMVTVSVKGKVKGTDQWVNIPNSQALDYNKISGDGFISGLGRFQISNNGEAVFEVTFQENQMKAQFKAISKPVHLESFKVTVPEVWYIDKWNGLAEGYLGIAQGNDPKKNYQFEYAPANAGNTKLNWEALNPDVAIHQYEFHNGIIPKKAGVATFNLTSLDNPKLTQTVSVEFKYLHPLEKATAKDAVITLKEGSYTDFTINTVPENATEQRFTWKYDKEGIVKVGDSINTDAGNVDVPHWTTHTVTALQSGVVKVTGIPYDTTANCKPVEFTVYVSKDGSIPDDTDYLKLAKDDIKHGVDELLKQDQNAYGQEWSIFSTLRAGQTIAQNKLDQYYASVEAKVKKDIAKMMPTDFARVIITLEAMGKDPSSVGGVNLLEQLYNSQKIENGSSNYPTWALIALDGWKSEIPADAQWTRENLIKKVLSFQTEQGGFGLFDNKTNSMDMTGMVVQALAPYYNDAKYPEVKTAVDRALKYMKSNMSAQAGYPDSCTTSQVLTAVTALKMDPLKAENGFTVGSKNLISYLHGYKVPAGGFGYQNAEKVNAMATEQVTYALVSYQRLADGMTSLYDLTDTAPKKPTVSFDDVHPNDYFYAPVIWAVENKITEGVGNNHFRPMGTCTRGQIVTFLWREAGCPEPKTAVSPFKDVQDPSAYYYKAVLWAAENKITEGVRPDMFKPHNSCTRGQVVTFLWRYKNQPAPKNTETNFTDVASSEYYTEAVAWAAENKIVEGVGDNRFAPSHTCTRGQIVTFLYRAKDVAPKP